MVTAAEGAEEFYNFSNEARYEDAAGARARDHHLRQAYMGHQKYMIVDNEAINFEEKINRSIGLVSSVIGLPTDVNVFKKYLLSAPVVLPDEIRSEKLTIYETYINVPIRLYEDLHRENITICVRERKKNGLKVYNYEKRYNVGDERIQEMRSISAREYFSYCKNKSETTVTLHKERICFVYQTHYFVMETYVNVPG